jgi:hypothetical protein
MIIHVKHTFIKKKQIEDLQKAVFYINDEIKRLAGE